MWFERLQAWWRRLRGVAQPEPRVAPGAGPGVVVRKRKYDGRIKSEWEGELLLSPGEGWLVVLHHPARHRKRSAGKWKLQSPVHVHCLHTASPLTVLLTYAEDGTFREAKCDAALPAVRDDHVIEFVDLDLDVIVGRDLTRFTRDARTFKRNRKRMGYPEHVVAQAQAGIALAQELLATRRFPFGPGLNREWFAND
jgi:protein associated with RNAse G/E